jgi:serine/threonine protein kinase
MTEGRRFADRFRVLKVIDRDGTTEISLAQDEQLDEWVALRVLGVDFSDRWEILRDVCRSARQLAHPHIARVFDFYRCEDTSFICREYVEGANIAEASGHSTEERLRVFSQAAAALEIAHDAGIVHGDLKASKILRDVRGHARIVDFQIASALRVASPSYGGDHLSPQVRSGESPVAADDVYSLGGLIARSIPSTHAPRELTSLVGAMTEEKRQARIADLGEIRQALETFANGDSPRPGTGSSETPRLQLASPPDRTPSRVLPSGGDDSKSSRNLQYAIAGCVLIAAALIVFVVLPHWVATSGDAEIPPETATLDEVRAAAPLGEKAPASKASVESLLARLIPMRERLEASAVERWGGTDFEEARRIESRGVSAFLERDYALAQTHYGDALEIVEGLTERRESVLAESLETGATAIETGNQQRAIEAFELALAIDPGNDAALAGARRAQNLAARISHMNAGNQFEADGSFESAGVAYAKALELDPEHLPAREALERLEIAQAENNYESNLSLALVAMAKGRFGAARNHFESARSIRPSSPEVADGMRQLQQIESSRKIASLRERAESAESAERYAEAASLFQKIVDTQDHLPFAEEGLERNRELDRISKRVASLLDDATQLFNPETLEEAGALLEQGHRIGGGRPQFADSLRNLKIVIQLASTPIPVVFKSDTLTEVVVRGVGSLGSFAHRDVPLKPGRYVVIGRRIGFRDTRSEVSVIPGKQTPTVEIRCTEEI